MKESPEGIVLYSWSGIIPTDVSTFVNNGKGIFGTLSNQNNPYGPSQIQSLVNKSGLIIVGNNAYIDLSDKYGTKHKTTEKLVLSSGLIETLDLVSEGEIEGPVSGEYVYSGNLGQTGWSVATFSGYSVPSGFESLRWLRSIYWDEVPILSDGAQFNFQYVDVSYAIGGPNGSNLQSLVNRETTSRTLGERFRGGSDQVKYYRILNPNCNGAIVNVKIPAMSETNPDNGDIGRTKIDWNISYRPLFQNIATQTDFNSPTFESVWGKISAAGGYVRSTQIDFNTSSFLSKSVVIQTLNSSPVGRNPFNPFRHITINPTGTNPVTTTVDTEINTSNFLNNPNFVGWEIKLVRSTLDATSSLNQNSTYVDSLTELYSSVLTYPCSALFKATFNAEFFSQVPERAFELKLLKVQIPGNYDPISRTYATGGFATTNGFWNGIFATGKQWTNNPAWCYYDLITNGRYGLGKFVNNLLVDPFTLYKIAQYCDELVADGFGGLEPRFTCNTWIGTREDAFKVINDFASVFRGMAYYAFGTIFTVQDSLKSPRVIFTNANVENGDFNYSNTSKKTRQSVAIVRYNDPRNFYKPAIEYVEDIDAIRRYGIRELDLTAFACTSRGQAIRLANWALLSNNLETETIQFTAGIEGSSLRPGDIIKVFDFNKKGKRYGGRIWNINNINGTGSVVTLDSPLDLQTGIDYVLSVLTPSFYYDTTQVSGLTMGDYDNIRRPFLQQFEFSGDTAYISSGKSIINLNTGFDTTNYSISGNPVFTIELGLNSQDYTGSMYFMDSDFDYYRVLNLKETDVNKNEIVGIQYNSSKFIQIDSGITYQRNSLPNSSKVPSSPHDLSLNTFNLSNSKQLIQYTFLIDDFKFINNYRVYINTGEFGTKGVPDNNYLYTTLPVDIIQGTYLPTNNLRYNFRIYSYNETDNIYSNNCASGLILVNTDLPIRDVIVGNLQLLTGSS